MKRTIAPVLLLLVAAANFSALAHADDRDDSGKSFTYADIIRISKNKGARGDLAPVVRIVSPLNGALVAPGESRVGDGNGSPNGTGFLVNVEIVTRDKVSVKAREANTPAPGIRHVPELEAGANNPDFPGLFVFFDTDLITPSGAILPKFNNFAAAFNVAGTDDTPGPGVTLWAGWHVLESIPENVEDMTITVAVVDDAGRIGLDQVKVKADRSKKSGQELTPASDTFPSVEGVESADGPEVSMIAPRVPTALAIGPADNSLNASNGSLFFIQVSALGRSSAGIAVNETGVREGNTFPAGLIFDPTQIPNAAAGTPGGPNRNFPGLVVTFDVPLRQPSGNVVPAGTNLAGLFDVAGSEVDAASGAIRTTADWVVGGSLVLPTGKETVTITSSVTDNAGRKGTTRSVLAVSETVSGQNLTTNP